MCRLTRAFSVRSLRNQHLEKSSGVIEDDCQQRQQKVKGIERGQKVMRGSWKGAGFVQQQRISCQESLDLFPGFISWFYSLLVFLAFQLLLASKPQLDVWGMHSPQQSQIPGLSSPPDP